MGENEHNKVHTVLRESLGRPLSEHAVLSTLGDQQGKSRSSWKMFPCLQGKFQEIFHLT